MTTLLTSSIRRAAHGRHICELCFRRITQGEKYEDARCCGDGTAWTFRSHLSCASAYASWEPYEEGYTLADLSDGHLPPCPMAWHKSDEPCTCPPKPCRGQLDIYGHEVA